MCQGSYRRMASVHTRACRRCVRCAAGGVLQEMRAEMYVRQAMRLGSSLKAERGLRIQSQTGPDAEVPCPCPRYVEVPMRSRCRGGVDEWRWHGRVRGEGGMPCDDHSGTNYIAHSTLIAINGIRVSRGIKGIQRHQARQRHRGLRPTGEASSTVSPSPCARCRGYRSGCRRWAPAWHAGPHPDPETHEMETEYHEHVSNPNPNPEP